ncbi:spore germination protein KC [Desulfitispora alkaliphila]|uniref:Ger(x)C family spore germination protein n=1 Tax=Desulfitispora alkaliphila TaxID=622674 RepID=UPI003D1A95BC
MMRGKNIALLIAVLVILLLAVGCWNRTELDERALVMGSALDKAPAVEEKYMVTVEIANPADLVSPLAGGGEGDTPSWIISSTGWTAFDAIRNFVMQVRRKLFWSHSQVFLIGEDLARDGIKPIIDLFIRDEELNRTMWIIVSKGSESREILEIEHLLGGLTSDALDSLVQASRISSQAVQVNISDLAKQLTDESRALVVGRVELVGQEEEQEETAEEQGNGGNEEGEVAETEDGQLLRYTGAAVLKEDKLVGWFDRKEARGYNWITNNVGRGIFLVECDEEQGRRIAINVLFSQAEMEVEFVQGKPVVTIEVEAEGDIGEVMCQQFDPMDYDQMSRIESRFAEIIRNEIKACLDKSRELEADVIGLGRQINIENHRVWRELQDDWDEIFSEIDFEIVVNAEVRRMGLIEKSFGEIIR